MAMHKKYYPTGGTWIFYIASFSLAMLLHAQERKYLDSVINNFAQAFTFGSSSILLLFGEGVNNM